MSRLSGGKDYKYTAVIVTFGMTLFLLMAGTSFRAAPAYSQATLDSFIDSNTNTDSTRNADGTGSTSGDSTTKDAGIVDDTTRTTADPILDTTRDAAGTVTDDSEPTSGTSQESDTTTQHTDPAVSQQTVLNELVVVRVTACIRQNRGIFLCDGKRVLFFEREAPELVTVDITPEQAKNIYNLLVSVKDTCSPISGGSIQSGCGAGTATDFYCSGAPAYYPRISKNGQDLVIFMPKPLPAVEKEQGTLTAESEVREPGTAIVEPEPIRAVEPTQEPVREIHSEQGSGTVIPLPVEDSVIPGTVDIPKLPNVIERNIESSAVDVPVRCIDAGITTSRQCAAFLDRESVPAECREAGIATVEACKRFLLEQEVDKLTTSGEMTVVTHGLPLKCERLGITDIVKCNRVIAETAVPVQCREAGVITRAACNTYLQETYLPQVFTNDACKDTDADTCLQTFKNQFTSKTKCIGLTQSECHTVLENEHFGTWLAVREDLLSSEHVASELSGKAILSTKRLETNEQEVVAQTITNDRPLYIYPSVGSVVLNEDNELVAAPPALIVLDRDGDGLSDQMEERIGTDPTKRDTDDDGFDDKTELQNGFDPLSTEKKQYGFWPVDSAMVFGLPLDQPLVSEAEVDATLGVSAVQGSRQTNGARNTIKGSGPSNSVVALYIYSTMPMVLTVQTDSDGNFEYVLEDSLADGEHQVYVALVDNLGSITKQSPPLSFFVREAQAVDTDEFFGFETVTVAPAEYPVSTFSRYYIIGAALLVLVAIGIAVFFIWNKRSENEIATDVDSDSSLNV